MVPISLIAPKSCHFMLGGLGHHLPTPPPQVLTLSPTPRTPYTERTKWQVSENTQEGGASQDPGLSHGLLPVAPADRRGSKTKSPRAQRQA